MKNRRHLLLSLVAVMPLLAVSGWCCAAFPTANTSADDKPKVEDKKADAKGCCTASQNADAKTADVKGCCSSCCRASKKAGCPMMGAAGCPAMADEPRSRTFSFTYATTVTGLAPGQTARVWLPVPSSGKDQDVTIVAKELPAEGIISREPQYGNQILYVAARAGADGTVPLKVVYRVTRREIKGGSGKDIEDLKKLARFLQADALVPIDGKPLELIKGKNLPKDQMAAARVLYEVVNGYMKYDKTGDGWGRGDAVWACECGRGNCSDFHSLFISLARSQKIPAKFEIGFLLPEQHSEGEVSGYHCWAQFQSARKGWVPVDISEAKKNPQLRDYYFGNLTENRVLFSTGRDIDLVPRQDGRPLNFFIYPYVEVDGKPHPADKIQCKCSYADVTQVAPRR
jgi:transglutaminase-like putative cysteine protease